MQLIITYIKFTFKIRAFSLMFRFYSCKILLGLFLHVLFILRHFHSRNFGLIFTGSDLKQACGKAMDYKTEEKQSGEKINDWIKELKVVPAEKSNLYITYLLFCRFILCLIQNLVSRWFSPAWFSPLPAVF